MLNGYAENIANPVKPVATLPTCLIYSWPVGTDHKGHIILQIFQI